MNQKIQVNKQTVKEWRGNDSVSLLFCGRHYTITLATEKRNLKTSDSGFEIKALGVSPNPGPISHCDSGRGVGHLQMFLLSLKIQSWPPSLLFPRVIKEDKGDDVYSRPSLLRKTICNYAPNECILQELFPVSESKFNFKPWPIYV